MAKEHDEEVRQKYMMRFGVPSPYRYNLYRHMKAVRKAFPAEQRTRESADMKERAVERQMYQENVKRDFERERRRRKQDRCIIYEND
jgi:hypothetical protein